MSRSSVRRQATRLVVVGALGLAGAAAPVRAASAAAPSSTSIVLSAPRSAYGQVVTASAAVTTAAGPAEGDVVFSVDGVAVKANLSGGGTATLVLPRAGVGAHAVQATFLPQDPLRQDGSTSPTLDWQVVPVRTRLQVQVTGKRLRGQVGVRVRAAGDYGTTASGRVRIVVRRAGRTVRTARGTLEGGSLAGALFLDPGPSRRGAYRVEVTYRGDADHLAARRVVRFRIGDRADERPLGDRDSATVSIPTPNGIPWRVRDL